MSDEHKLWNRDFVSVCLSSFFLFMTFYILAVTLPIFASESLSRRQSEVGLAMTVFIFATVIFRPLAGKWMDERNRKTIIVGALVLYALSSLAYLGVHHFYLLLALRFVHGISFGIAATATGAIAVDLVPDKRKGEGIGYFSLFMSLAMVIGPFVGLVVMDQYNDAVLFSICLAFSLLSLLCGILIQVPARAVHKDKTMASGWRKLVEPGAIPIAIVGSILAFSYGAITTFISVYAKYIGIGAYASYFFVVFAAMIVLSRPFTGRLYDRSGEHVLVYPGLLLFTVGMIILSQATGPFVFLVSGGIIGLGFGALLPSFQTIAVQSSPKHRRGLATATYFLLFDSGYGLGSYVLGVTAAAYNYHTMYLIAAIVVACAAPLYYGMHHRRKGRLS